MLELKEKICKHFLWARYAKYPDVSFLEQIVNINQLM